MGLPVLKIRAGGAAEAVVEHAPPLFVGTHWFGRQVLCVGEDCQGCLVKPGRVRGFSLVSADVGGRPRLFVLENSTNEWARLEGLLRGCGELLAAGVKLHLGRRRPQSPLRMEPDGLVSCSFAGEASAHRLLSAVAVLHGLPLPAAEATLGEYVARARPAAEEILRACL